MGPDGDMVTVGVGTVCREISCYQVYCVQNLQLPDVALTINSHAFIGT